VTAYGRMGVWRVGVERREAPKDWRGAALERCIGPDDIWYLYSCGQGAHENRRLPGTSQRAAVLQSCRSQYLSPTERWNNISRRRRSREPPAFTFSGWTRAGKNFAGFLLNAPKRLPSSHSASRSRASRLWLLALVSVSPHEYQRSLPQRS
jgi:hypothetical protein